DDIEYAEQQERESLAQWVRAHEKKHEQERGNLVPYDRGVVRDAEVASGSIRGPDPDRERRSDDEYESEIIGKGPQQCGEREREAQLLRNRADLRGRARRCGKAQLIVVATRQQAIERKAAFISGETLIQDRGTRQRRELKGCAHARSIENVTEIADEAIGNIDGGGRDAAQAISELDPWRRPQQCSFTLRKLVRGKDHALPMMRESERGIAQPAGDKDRVTRTGAAPAQRLSRRHLAQDRHAEIERTLGRITADQIHVVRIGKREETARERANPRRICVRQRARK